MLRVVPFLVYGAMLGTGSLKSNRPVGRPRRVWWQRWIGITFDSAAGFAMSASSSLNLYPQTGHVKRRTADTAHCRLSALG